MKYTVLVLLIQAVMVCAQRQEQEDQWILEVAQEAHQSRLTLLAGNLVHSYLLQARIGFRLAQVGQLCAQLLQDGIGIGTRFFKQFKRGMCPIPGSIVSGVPRIV